MLSLKHCFDGIGWASGRASSLQKLSDWVCCWCGYLSGGRCSPTDATAITKPHRFLSYLNPDCFYLSGTGSRSSSSSKRNFMPVTATWKLVFDVAVCSQVGIYSRPEHPQGAEFGSCESIVVPVNEPSHLDHHCTADYFLFMFCFDFLLNCWYGNAYGH